MTRLAAFLLMVATIPAAAQVRIGGAMGVSCKTPEATIQVVNAMVPLSDDQVQILLDNIQEATKDDCAFGPLDGVVTRIVKTFVRADQRVVEILEYRPALMITQKRYIFQVQRTADGVGL